MKSVKLPGMSEISKQGFQARRQTFFETASATTGLTDFGPDDYSGGLDLFLHCLDEEAVLSPAGDVPTGGFIEMYLASRHSDQQNKG